MTASSVSRPIVDPATGDLTPTTNSSRKGVLVSCLGVDPASMPCAGDYVQATGIASGMEVMQDGNTSIIRPCLRLRSEADLFTPVLGPGPQLDGYVACYKPLPAPAPSDRHFVDSTGTVIPLGSTVRLKNALVVPDAGPIVKVVHTYGQDSAAQYVDSAGNRLYLDTPGTWSLIDTQFALPIHAFVTVTGTTSAGAQGEQIEPDSFQILSTTPAVGNMAALVACQSLSEVAQTRVARVAGLTLNEDAAPWPTDTSPTPAEVIASPDFQAIWNAQGNLGWALAQPDSTVISLAGEGVQSVSTDGCTIALREWFGFASDPPALVLALNSPVTRNLGAATIDIVGATLTTLSGEQRALISPQAVYVYVSDDGTYALPVPSKDMLGSFGQVQIAP